MLVTLTLILFATVSTLVLADDPNSYPLHVLEVQNDPSLFQGDMIMGKSSREDFINSIQPWTDGKIYYTLDSSFSDEIERIIENKFGELEDQFSCIEFIKRTKEPTWVHIKNGGRNCDFVVGMPSTKGEHVAHLPQKCHHQLVILHGILHLLGLTHAHSYPNRKLWLDKVEPKKTMRGHEKDLDITFPHHLYKDMKKDLENGLFSPLQYGPYAFSNNGEISMHFWHHWSVVPSLKQIVAVYLSDVQQINHLYKCPSK